MDYKFTKRNKQQLKDYEGIDVVSDDYYFYALKNKNGNVRFVIAHVDNNKDPMKKYERLDIFNKGEETGIHYQTDIRHNPIIHIIKNKTPVEMGDGIFRVKFKYPNFLYRLINKIKWKIRIQCIK